MQFKVLILGFVALTGLLGYINVHDPWFELVAILAVGAIIMGMPDPKEDSTVLYKWVYRSTHIFFNIATNFLMHESAWKALEPKAGILKSFREEPVEGIIKTEIVRPENERGK